MPNLKIIFDHYKGVCHYCGRSITIQEASRDHKLAQSRGGDESWDNILLACKPCNRLKANRSYMEFTGKAESKRPDNPPVDCDAERALIASILLGNKLPKQDVKFAEIVKAIGNDDDLGTTAFVDERMRTIYKHMRRLWLQKKPYADATILMGSIRDAGEQETNMVNGNAVCMLDLILLIGPDSPQPIWWHWRHYLDRVVAQRKARQRLHRCEQAASGELGRQKPRTPR